MGQAPSVTMLHVQPDMDPNNPDYGIGFSPLLFAQEDAQWMELAAYCRENKISQRTLNKMFNRSLGDNDAFLRAYRVRMDDVKLLFELDPAPINRDFIDLFVPFIFRKSLAGLKETPHLITDVTFARFVICAHDFCRQPMSDILYDFLACCRANPQLNVSTWIYGFNFQQIILLMTEYMRAPPRSYGVVHVLKTHCFEDEEDNLVIRNIIQIGLKYPLLFYPLYAFVQKRLRKTLCLPVTPLSASRLEFHADSSKFSGLQSREEALAETAGTMIADVLALRPREGLAGRLPRYFLHSDRPPRIQRVTAQHWLKLKQALGFRCARDLVLESKLSCDTGVSILGDAKLLAESNRDVRLRDDAVNRDFVYNVASGRRAWVDAVREHAPAVVGEDGDSSTVLRETTHQSGPMHSYYS